MAQGFEAIEIGDLPVELEEEAGDDDAGSSSLWLLIALGLLALVLIWIILGIWRYLQVLGNGTF